MLNHNRSVNMEKLTDAMVEIREDDALEIVNERVKAGEDLLKIIEECRNAMVTIGEKFEVKEYFVPELIMAAEIFREIMEIVEPKMQKGRRLETLGKVVIGTVQGDVHDIGKNIVVSMLKVNGFDAYDLGADVPPEEFVEKIKEVEPEVVGLSALMTSSWESMKKTVKAIKDAGLRKKVKIIVGGGICSKEVADYVGADAYGRYVTDAIAFCKEV